MSASDAPRVELPPEFRSALEKLRLLVMGVLHDAKFDSCHWAWHYIERAKSGKKKKAIFNQQFEQWREGSASAIREWLPRFVHIASAYPEVIDDPIHWAKDRVWETVEDVCGVQRGTESEPLAIDWVVNDIMIWWFAVASEFNPEVNLPPSGPWSAPRWLALDPRETNELLEEHTRNLWLRVNRVIEDEIASAEIRRASNRRLRTEEPSAVENRAPGTTPSKKPSFYAKDESNPLSPFVFEEFPNNDWESVTPPPLMEAVLSLRKLAADGFFRSNTLLKKEEEKLGRELRAWVAFGVCYKNREAESQRAACEVFEAFLQIAKANRVLGNASPVAWAYGQTYALLRHEFGSAQSLQEFHKIKLWVKEFCDGKKPRLTAAPHSDEDWKEYLCRESWRAPLWLRIAAYRHFNNDSSAWDESKPSGLQRLDKEETEELLNGICRWFWSAVHAVLENKARLESIELASEGAGGPTIRSSRIERSQQSNSPTLLRFVRRGRTLIAETCGDMESAINETYKVLLPFVGQVKSIVRASGAELTVKDLQSEFKSTYFARALEQDDWDLLIEEFRRKRSAGQRNLTVALLSRRTGRSLATVETYTRPGRKRKKTAHQ
jgi:hypothetical protein